MKVLFTLFIFGSATCFAQFVYTTAVREDHNSRNSQKSLVQVIGLINSFHKLTDFPDLNDIQLLKSSILKMEALPLLPGDIELLIGLYLRHFQITKSNEFHRRIFSLLTMHQNLQKYYFELWSEVNNSLENKIEFYSTQKLLRLQKWVDNKSNYALFIDGLKIESLHQIRISQLPHQWLLVSNTHYPILSSGSFDNFINLAAQMQAFDGSCGSQIQIFPGITFLKAALISDNSCVPEGEEHKISKSNHQEKINWKVPVAITIGALIVSSLKDKKIVFKMPGSK